MIHCLKCTSGEVCTQCEQNYYISADKKSCVLICEQSYPDFESNSCILCSSSNDLSDDCSDCLSSTKCLGCASLFYYKGDCLAECPVEN